MGDARHTEARVGARHAEEGVHSALIRKQRGVPLRLADKRLPELEKVVHGAHARQGRRGLGARRGDALGPRRALGKSQAGVCQPTRLRETRRVAPHHKAGARHAETLEHVGLHIGGEIHAAHILHDDGREKRIEGRVAHHRPRAEAGRHVEQREGGRGVRSSVGKRRGRAHHGDVQAARMVHEVEDVKRPIPIRQRHAFGKVCGKRRGQLELALLDKLHHAGPHDKVARAPPLKHRGLAHGRGALPALEPVVAVQLGPIHGNRHGNAARLVGTCDVGVDQGFLAGICLRCLRLPNQTGGAQGDEKSGPGQRKPPGTP